MSASPATVRVFAPASVSNVACGFDALGFAIEGLGDEIVARCLGPAATPRVQIGSITGDGGALPLEPARNTASVAAAAVLARSVEAGHAALAIELEISKQMPLTSGLGSSAASAVGGALAAAELLSMTNGFELTMPELLNCALEGEFVASGGRHADNVAPSLLGGFVLVRSLDGLPDVVALPRTDDWLWCALVRPELGIDTLASRQRLGTHVALPDAIRQWANVGALVAALFRRDPALLSRSLEDRVAEPVRRGDVPGFDAAKKAALAAGALGASLSGSGPSLFALATSSKGAGQAALAMATVLAESTQTSCTTLVSAVGAAGARVLSRNSEARS